jgi:tetratricopeptide (TPR) repeat protein
MSEPATLMLEADRLIAARDLESARRVLSKILSLREDASAYVKLSYLESACSNHALANRHAVVACDLHPTDPETSLRLMNRLRHFNESGALNSYISRSTHLDKLGPQGLHSVAAHLSFLEEHRRSLEFFDRLLHMQPTNHAALLARGQIHMFLGDFEKSEQDLRACIRLSPTTAQAWWTLSQIKKSTDADNRVPQLREMLASSPSAQARAYLGFALHKELDDLGDTKGASQALTLACALRRRDQDYSEERSRAMFEKLVAIERWPDPEVGAREEGLTPVFIVGMFRSGTTLLERLISGNRSVRSGGELRDFSSCLQYLADHHCKGIIDETIIDRIAGIDHAVLGARYLEKVRWRLRGRTHLTDKMPANFLHVGSILSSMPGAKVLHMVRDPVATCFSNLREHFSGLSPYSYDQVELANYYVRYARLMAHWHALFPGRILDVSYAALTTATEDVMRQVAEFCGLAFEHDMLDPRAGKSGVATASAVQVREPVTQRAVQKWQPYRAYLAPLIARLEQAGLVDQSSIH